MIEDLDGLDDAIEIVAIRVAGVHQRLQHEHLI
jgi:hypothetical protein